MREVFLEPDAQNMADLDRFRFVVGPFRTLRAAHLMVLYPLSYNSVREADARAEASPAESYTA